MATPRMAAGIAIRDPGGRILLVRPTYKDGWDIPGGYVEPGESPAEACHRELKEEIGLDRELGTLLVGTGRHTRTRATSCCSSSTAVP
jgi:8-oxo-dGTP diphosphatase